MLLSKNYSCRDKQLIKKEMNPQKKILFVSYGGGHINTILPIYKKCKKNGFNADLIALTGAKLVTESQNIKSLGFIDFVEEKEREKFRKFGEKIINENYDQNSGIDREESIYYLGINWSENLERYGEEKTKLLYKKIKRHSFLPIKFFEKIIQKNNYKLVITTNSPKSERAALIAANRLNIKSIRLEDLFFEDHLQLEINEKLGNDFSSSIGKYKSTPSKIFVMCQLTKDMYKLKKKTLLLGTKESDVIVTGQPILDRLAINSSSLEIKKQNNYVLWSHANRTLDGNEVLNMISFWLEKFSSNTLPLAIKLHPDCPNEERSYIDKSLLKLSNNYFFIESNLSIEEAIISSKVLIAQNSTTMLEAFFLRKPSICLDPKNMRKNIPYLKCGICQRATNCIELNDLITKSEEINDKRFEKIKGQMGLSLNATEKIFSELKNLIRN